MIELLRLCAALVGGFGLGVFYFGGLWWTVQRLPTARYPALVSLGSFLGRLGVVLLCFYLLTDGHWLRLLFCLLSFLVARHILVRRWGPVSKHRSRFRRGVDHAYHA